MSERVTAASVSYESPPVTETSLGVQFASLPGWDVNLFGLLQDRLRNEYPRFASAPPIALDVQPSVLFINVPKIRAIYTSETQTDVVQVQSDFFFVNWRKMPHAAAYPRYQTIRARFVAQWSIFLAFLADQAIAAPQVSRYQVTYVNHAEEGTIRPGDLLTSWATPSGSDPHGLAISATYRLAEKNADVTIAMQPAVRTVDNVRVTQTTITTTRTMPSPAEQSDPATHLDDMHDVLIDTFQAITSSDAKAHWGPV